MDYCDMMRKLKQNIGWNLVSLLAVLPIIIWLFTPKINPPFSSISNISASLGALFALVGIVMFSLNFILSTRLHFIENLFNGLNNVYKKHNLLGQLAFILLLFHPLFLLPRYSSSLKEAATFLFISGSWARNLGIFSLGKMLVLIVLTLFLMPKYNFWKITHKFFGLALFFGTLHVYLIPSYIMNSFILKTYVLFLAVLGIIAFVYRTILGQFLIERFIYSVQDVNKLDAKTIEISLKAKDRKIPFHPGQFIFISFFQSGLSKEEHPFSISSSPDEDLLTITVKILGDYTAQLFNSLQKGTMAKVEGPFGVFSYKNCNNKNQIWIGGGIGITPFVSFIKSIKQEMGYNIKLFYCVRNKEDALYLKFFQEYENGLNHQFKVIPFYSEEKGHISKEYIARQVSNLEEYDFFLCAPPKMIQELRGEFTSRNVQINKIHSEEFNF